MQRLSGSCQSDQQNPRYAEVMQQDGNAAGMRRLYRRLVTRLIELCLQAGECHGQDKPDGLIALKNLQSADNIRKIAIGGQRKYRG